MTTCQKLRIQCLQSQALQGLANFAISKHPASSCQAQPASPASQLGTKDSIRAAGPLTAWSQVLPDYDTRSKENHQINEPELLFNRIEDSEIQLQIDKLKKNN